MSRAHTQPDCGVADESAEDQESPPGADEGLQRVVISGTGGEMQLPQAGNGIVTKDGAHKCSERERGTVERRVRAEARRRRL